MKTPILLSFLTAALLGSIAMSESITVYSARHYGGDADLFGAFTKETGISVNIVEAKGGALLEKIKAEGENCPADILLTVDAARLGAADNDGVFQAVKSEILNQRLPASMRHPEGHWFGFGRRARVTVIAPERVKPSDIENYDDLTDEKFKGRIVVRSSGNVYNQSLLADIIARQGAPAATDWAKGVLRNMARKPQGNDRAQIKAVAAGEADVAIVNHYYFARMVHSEDPAERAAAAKVSVHFPGQNDGSGVHVNISGAGLLKHAPNSEGGKKLLEFLASDTGQKLFVKPSWEYPAVKSVGIAYPEFPKTFKAADVNAAELAANNKKALMVFDIVGWQ